MYLVVIAWLYVALMMAVAEATSPIGSVTGAFFTFVLYGVAPVSLVVYLMLTPARKVYGETVEVFAQNVIPQFRE